MKNLFGIIISFIVIFSFFTCNNGTIPDPNIFRVTFNSNGGSVVPFQDIPEGGKATKPKGVSQQINFALEGWYSDNNTFENKWDFDIDTVVTDITLFAKWQAVDPLDYDDFGPVLVTETYTVANTTHWNNVLNVISSGGNDNAYIINITDDFTVEGKNTNTFGSVSDVMVSLRSTGKTISLSGNGNILRIENNQSLVLRDVNLKGNEENNESGNSENSSLVYINNSHFNLQKGKIFWNGGNGITINKGSLIIHVGEISDNYIGVSIIDGSFTMHEGKISGNSSGVSISDGSFIMHKGEIYNNYRYGVYMYTSNNNTSFILHDGNIYDNNAGVITTNGSFIMNGGTINNNTKLDASNSAVGVSIADGVFTMNGGNINNNERGVSLFANSTFIMNNGTINGNTTTTYSGILYTNGAGVNVFDGSNFIMNGGTISNNTATSIDEQYYTYVSRGGGVNVGYYFVGSSFTMNAGTISGNTAGEGGGVMVGSGCNFTMTGGTISGNTADRNNRGGGGVNSRGNFNKTGGIIYGKNESLNSNIAEYGDTFGHSVYYESYDTGFYFYRDTTLNSNNNINTNDELPANIGETLNGWTKR